MSQQLAPDPAAAAATLAATVPNQPDLSNRRDIPVSSFDFLQGSYLATRRIRSAALGALAVLTLFVTWTGYSVVATRSDSAEARVAAQQLRARQEEAIASLGDVVGTGVDVRVVIDRDMALSEAIAMVVASQVDLLGLLESVEASPTGGVTVAEISIGDQAVGDRSDLKAGPAPKVLLVGTSEELRRLVGWADALRTAGIFDSFSYVRSPGSIEVSGYTTVKSSAKATIEKALSLGLSVDMLTKIKEAKPAQGAAASSTTTTTTVPTQGDDR